MAHRRPAQLALDWLAPLQWHDLPPDLRVRLGALLAEVLRQAAAGRDHEAGDDQ
jgi:hypothetical protein